MFSNLFKKKSVDDKIEEASKALDSRRDDPQNQSKMKKYTNKLKALLDKNIIQEVATKLLSSKRTDKYELILDLIKEYQRQYSNLVYKKYKSPEEKNKLKDLYTYKIIQKLCSRLKDNNDLRNESDKISKNLKKLIPRSKSKSVKNRYQDVPLRI